MNDLDEAIRDMEARLAEMKEQRYRETNPVQVNDIFLSPDGDEYSVSDIWGSPDDRDVELVLTRREVMTTSQLMSSEWRRVKP